MNLLPAPHWSRVPAWLLLYSSRPRLVASYACNAPVVPFSAAHRIAFEVPFAEIAGNAPGYVNVVGLFDAAVVASSAFVMGSALMLSFSAP